MKKYLRIEIPCRPNGEVSPAVLLAVGEISEFATRTLHEAGVAVVAIRHEAREDGEI